MISLQLKEAASGIAVELMGKDVLFSGCSTDSRNVHAGELFIALRGDRYDGHDFIESALAAGAIAFLGEFAPRDCGAPWLKAGDTREAMGALAGYWRRRFRIPLVAITGSNGKTTVKEMLTRILSLTSRVLSTRGNLNNEVGVPLTLYGLGDEHHYGVIEMGASGPGEIHRLSCMVQPSVALITQCAPAHLEGFGSLEGVARAKSEIYDGLPEQGVAVINQDDPHAGLWLDKTRDLRQILFGRDASCDVTCSEMRIDPDTGGSIFSLRLAGASVEVRLALPGQHNIYNAMAAAACCLALDIPLDQIRSGLEAVDPVPGRMQSKRGLRGSRIVDDSYNANPGSLEAALQSLSSLPDRKWLVLGDMAELGPSAPQLHEKAGEKARQYGFERLYTIGRYGQYSASGFGTGARQMDSRPQLIAELQEEIHSGICLLVKGSRTMALELVVKALLEEG